MASEKAYEPTEEQIRIWDEWVASRSPQVRAVAERFPPWYYIRNKDTGQLGQIQSFDEQEDGTVTLTTILCMEGAGPLAAILTRNVFGVSPDSLEITSEIPDYVVEEPRHGK